MKRTFRVQGRPSARCISAGSAQARVFYVRREVYSVQREELRKRDISCWVTRRGRRAWMAHEVGDGDGDDDDDDDDVCRRRVSPARRRRPGVSDGRAGERPPRSGLMSRPVGEKRHGRPRFYAVRPKLIHSSAADVCPSRIVSQLASTSYRVQRRPNASPAHLLLCPNINRVRLLKHRHIWPRRYEVLAEWAQRRPSAVAQHAC